MASKRIIRYKCPYCDKRFERRDLVAHVEQKHEDMIPENYTALRLVFNYVNKKPLDYNGKCTECGGPTQWDENKGRYDRQCQKKACKESYLRKFEQNMMRTKGVTRISATADGQEKMLANRKISGEYTFQDGTKKTYTGSYERKALEFMDKVMEMDPDDIVCPGPVLEYTYDGKTHIYITDFYYQPYNLIIEVKDGGNNPNKRNMPEYRAKQIAKEKFIIQHTNYNYLRLTDNDFSQLLSVFVDLKYEMTENTGERVIHVNEDMDVLENIDEAFNIFDFIIKKANNQPQISYANNKSRTSSDTFENLGGSLFNQVKLDLTNKQFIIKGINFEKFLLRLKEMYEYRGITKLFEKQYSNFDLKLWKLGLKSKNNMKIHELTIPLYFALEIHNIFMNLGEFYNLNFYKEIARNIYKKTWVSNFENKSEIPRLNIGILNNVLNPEYKLKDYQKTFIEEYNNFKYIYDLDGYILCFEQGLGKTLTSIALAESLGKDQIIIVCPNSLKENWVNEIGSYYKIYNDNRARLVNDVYAHGVSKFTSAKNPKFIIVNQDVIDKIYNVAKKDKDSIIIVDEIHNFRNIDSIRSKMLIKLKEIIDCKDNLLMSGTPIKAEATEIIPMLRMIDPYFTEELALIYKKAFNNNSIQVADVVKSRFSRIIYRKTKDEVLDLPNKNISNLELPCRNSQKYLISEVKAEISKEIKNQIESRKDSVERYKLIFESMVLDYSTAPMKETKDYLKYIANIGSEYVDEDEADYQDLVYKKFLNDYVYPNILDKSERAKFDEARTNYVYFKQSCIGKAIGKILPPANTSCYIDIFNDNLNVFIKAIRSSTKKTVIFTPFLEVANHINETLNKKGIGSVKIVGTTNDRMDIINSFKNDDTIDVLVATVQTLSTGVTLTEADQMFFFGVPYRKADFDQACDRIHRIGQTKDVSIYVVLLKTTQNNITNRINDIMVKSGESSNSLIYFEGYDYLEESKDVSTLTDGFKTKSGKTFKLVDVDTPEALKYVSEKWRESKNGKTLYVALSEQDDYEIAGFIGWNKSGNIAPLKVYEKFRGYGLSEILLKLAIKNGGHKLGVYSDNEVAIRLYNKFGFIEVDRKTYKDGDIVIIMELKNKINESVSFDEYHPVYLISMSYKSPLEKPIELFTGSKYAHSCVVIDNDFDHMYSFNGDSRKTLASKFLGGFSAEPLGLFKKINPNGLFTTSVLFVKTKDYEKLQDKLDKYILNQDKTKYNFTGLLNVPIKKETITRENRMFCSQFVDALFKFIGVDITGKSSNLVSPKDIANIQNKKVYNIYSGTIKDFNPRKCIELTRRLSNKADYIKESFEYEIVDEMYTKDEYDIMYNKELFDNGDINLCFITGHSGSGKSTYAHYLEKKYHPNIEAYELDDVIASYNFSDENLKEYGDMISSFFKKNPKYRIPNTYNSDNVEEWIKDNKFTSIPEYSNQVSKEFVKYAKNFVKYHSRKYIIEGIQLFCYFKPEEFKDYAFYIKGTSAFKSWIRSAIRDGKDGFKNKWMMLKDYNWYEQQLYKFRDYYAPKAKNYKEEEMDLDESAIIFNELMSAVGYAPVVGIEKSDAYIVNYMSNQVFNGEPSEYYRDKIAVTNSRDLHDVVGLDDKQRLRKLKLEEIHNPILYKSGKTNEEVSTLMERCMNSVVFKDYVYETVTGQRVYGDVESQAAATLDRVEILDREKFFKILKDYLLPTDEIDLEITNLENKIRDIKNNL